jgi:uncharacterized protein (TIGR03437 family)
MRRVLARLGVLIVLILFAAFYPQWAKSKAGAGLASSLLKNEVGATEVIDPPLVQLARLTASDGATDDRFANSVAVSGDTLVVGAESDDIGSNNNQGSAYVYVKSGVGWKLQQKLTADDGAAGDRFGGSVAISGDAVVIGAPFDDTATNADQGSAYVFVRVGAVWTLQGKLTANDGAANDGFGGAVAIGGDALVVGADGDSVEANEAQGSAYAFARSGPVWSFQQKLIAQDGGRINNFGNAIAISGDALIVGAYQDNIGANISQGSAYVFMRSGGAWSFQQKLTAPDGADDDQFGCSVALSGDYSIVGSCRSDIDGNANQGAALIFVRSGSVWSFQQKLTAPDGEEGDLFGISVALRGKTALVGAHLDDIGTAQFQGSAHLFSLSGADWSERQKLTAQEGESSDTFGGAVALSDDALIIGASGADAGAKDHQGALYLFGCGYLEKQTLTSSGGGGNDGFGGSAAIDGDVAVIGVPLDDVGGAVDQGSAVVFERNGASWMQTAQLFANDGAAGEEFGRSVAISGDSIVISAHRKNINGNREQGAAYIFVRSGGTWTQQLRLVASDGAASDHFGYSVSISGARLAVGAPQDDIDGKLDQGSVYLFTRSGSTWTPEIKLTANDGLAGDTLGGSAALEGELLIAAAPLADIGANKDQGAVYVFERPITPWRQRAKLIAEDGAAGDLLGASLALSRDTAIAGAPPKRFDSNSPNQGAAYVFAGPSAPTGNWSQQAILKLDDPAAGDQLGASVALNGDQAVVGAPTKIFRGGIRQGAAFVFARESAHWSLQQPIVAAKGQADVRFGSSAALTDDTIIVGESIGGDSRQGVAYILKSSCGPPLASFASVSAASFVAGGQLAPESITAGFGSNLCSETIEAASRPLPTTLGGLSLKVTDSAGIERLAPLFFISPGQINYLTPPGAANGPATVMVSNSVGPVASGAAQISSVAPGLFSANSNGQGVPAGFALRVTTDGSQLFEPVAQFDSAQNRFIPKPIDLGPAADQVFLALYGTGLRYHSSLTAVSCVIGGANQEVLYAGAAPGFVGLEQVNVRLSRALIGRQEVDVALSVDGRAANTLRVSIR